jgi:hypothetical protein
MRKRRSSSTACGLNVEDLLEIKSAILVDSRMGAHLFGY